MEIVTRVLTTDEYRTAIADAEQFYHFHSVQHVFVAFGWGCDCPDADLYEDKLILLSTFQRFLSEAEKNDYYRVSKDNLHFKDESGRSQFLFCHEADIHFSTDDAALKEEVFLLWQSRGFQSMRPAM